METEIKTEREVLWSTDWYSDEEMEAKWKEDVISDEFVPAEDDWIAYVDELLRNLQDNLKFYMKNRGYSEILVRQDIGLWDGRKVSVAKLKDVDSIFSLNGSGDCTITYWKRDKDLGMTVHHHDGTNEYLYRFPTDNDLLDPIKYISLINPHDFIRETEPFFDNISL